VKGGFRLNICLEIMDFYCGSKKLGILESKKYLVRGVRIEKKNIDLKDSFQHFV